MKPHKTFQYPCKPSSTEERIKLTIAVEDFLVYVILVEVNNW